MLQKKIFKISGMHCNTCSLNIDWELEETKGVKAAKTSYAREKTEVTYDSDVLKPDQIIRIIKNTGYDASLIDN